VEYQLAGRRGGVEPLPQRAELQLPGLEPVDRLQELLQRAAEPIEADHKKDLSSRRQR
jgi:hypothetical protein